MNQENQRVILTRQRLENALLAMLKTRTIHQISIRELSARAGINRTTFYNHYGSQYELLDDISRRYLASVAERLNSAEITSRESIRQRVTLVLHYIADHIELSALLMNNSIDPTFAERLFSLQQITELLNAALGGCHDPREREATIAFTIHGSFRLLQEWINQPDRISPEEQAMLMLRLARRACGGASDSSDVGRADGI